MTSAEPRPYADQQRAKAMTARANDILQAAPTSRLRRMHRAANR